MKGEKKCKQTVDDLLKLYTIVDERKLTDALPRFVAEDLSRVPSVTSDSMNMLAMAKNLEVLEQRMKTVEQLMTKSALETACHTSDSSCDDRLSSVEQLLAQLLNQKDTTDAGTCSGVSADVNTVDSNSLSVSQQLPVCDDQSQKDGPWQTVSYKKLKIMQNADKSSSSTSSSVHNRPSSSVHQQSQSTRRSNVKVFGSRQDNTTLKSGVPIVRKAVVHIDNLDPDCTTALLSDYLLAAGVQVLSCFNAKSWLHDNEKDQVTAFRVCVQASERHKLFEPDLWSTGVIIRDWRFKKSRDGGT